MADDFEQELKQGFLEEATQLLGEAEQCFLMLDSMSRFFASRTFDASQGVE